MRLDELDQRLEKMSEAEYVEFLAKLGGEKRTRKQFIGAYVRDPQHERLICYLVGLKTEEEKLTEAAQGSAEAAATSAKTARLSITISVVALVISIVGILLNRVL